MQSGMELENKLFIQWRNQKNWMHKSRRKNLQFSLGNIFPFGCSMETATRMGKLNRAFNLLDCVGWIERGNSWHGCLCLTKDASGFCVYLMSHESWHAGKDQQNAPPFHDFSHHFEIWSTFFKIFFNIIKLLKYYKHLQWSKAPASSNGENI